MIDRYSQAWGGRGRVTPSTTDRILVGSCAAIWLALVGMSVAALVALMDLGRGFHAAKGNPHTSSVLYAIIIISALIILAAIPMLLAPPDHPGRTGGSLGGFESRTVSARSIRTGQAAATRRVPPSGSPRDVLRWRTPRLIASGCAVRPP